MRPFLPSIRLVSPKVRVAVCPLYSLPFPVRESKVHAIGRNMCKLSFIVVASTWLATCCSSVLRESKVGEIDWDYEAVLWGK